MSNPKRPVRIVTDVEELRRLWQQQPKVTREQARQSIIAGVKAGRADGNGNVR